MRLSWGFTSISCMLFFPCICVAQNQCFAPNGQVNDNFFPCDPTATHSTCCDVGSTCLTNKLCRGPDGNLIRGLCTDKNWESPECAYYCMSAIRGGHDLISCSNVTNTDTAFCCDRHRAFCCDDGVARFEVLPTKPQAWAKWDDDETQFVVVEGLKTTSTTRLPAVTATSTTLSTTPPTGSAGTDQTQSAPTSSANSDANIAPQSESSALPLGAQAGIGAGIGVLVLALAAVAFLLWKLRQNKKALAEKDQPNSGVLPAYHHTQQYAVPAPLPPGKELYHQTGLGGPGQARGLGVDMVAPRYEMDPHAYHTHAFGGRVELSALPR